MAQNLGCAKNIEEITVENWQQHTAQKRRRDGVIGAYARINMKV
jgi:hypothetical protein